MRDRVAAERPQNPPQGQWHKYRLQQSRHEPFSGTHLERFAYLGGWNLLISRSQTLSPFSMKLSHPYPPSPWDGPDPEAGDGGASDTSVLLVHHTAR